MPNPLNERAATGRHLLGAAINRRRSGLGLTLREVSARSGLSYHTVISVENGRRLPSLEALDAIAVALDTIARALLRNVYPWDGGEPPAS